MMSLDILSVTLAGPTLLVGFLSCLGLLFLRRPVAGVLSGFVGAMVGYVMLVSGALMAQESLSQLSEGMHRAFSIAVLVPHNEAMAAWLQSSVGVSTLLIFALGLFVHLSIARFTHLHFLFLTPHQMFFMATLFAVVLQNVGLSMPLVVLAGALFLGCWSSLSPALGQRWTRRVTDDDAVALGHFGSLGFYAASWLGQCVSRQCVTSLRRSSSASDASQVPRRSTEDVRMPPFSNILRDVTVTTSLSMTFIFLVTALVAVRPLSSAVIHALLFAVGIAVVLAGLRLLLADVPALLTALSSRFVPDAIFAVDCAALFPYAPSAVVIGFLCSLLGSLLGMVGIGLLSGLWVLPSIVPHFFCGATAGIYGNATGGLRGAVAGAMLNGLLLAVLPAILSVFVVSPLPMTFGDTDYAIFGTILGAAGQMLGPLGIATLAVGALGAVCIWGRRKR